MCLLKNFQNFLTYYEQTLRHLTRHWEWIETIYRHNNPFRPQRSCTKISSSASRWAPSRQGR
jgi:hypothetical protein